VRRRSRRRSWGSPFAGLLPPAGVRAFPAALDRSMHDAFASRWHRRIDRTASARPGPHARSSPSPRPTVSVGGSTFLLLRRSQREGRSRMGGCASGLRSRLRSVPAAVRLLRRADPALGFSSRLSQGVCATPIALATRTLSRSVACRATALAHRASPSFFGRARHSPGSAYALHSARAAIVLFVRVYRRTSGKQYR
jgi:hypothetical protein